MCFVFLKHKLVNVLFNFSILVDNEIEGESLFSVFYTYILLKQISYDTILNVEFEFYNLFCSEFRT